MSLPDALRDQAVHCAALGSPFMERALTVLADNWPTTGVIADKFAGFEGDIGPAGHSLPLRLMGGLHALVLTGQAADLKAVYPPHVTDDETLAAALTTAISDHSAFLDAWTDSAPQTNEVRRSAAVIPAAHYIASNYDLPFMTSELGASAGLNLMFDHFAVEAAGLHLGAKTPALTLTPDWTGDVPEAVPFKLADRAGVDLNPLDAHTEADGLRLLAYLWPDQAERLTLTRAAINVLDAPLHKGDAVDWLETRLGAQQDGQLHLIYHTIAWQYFPKAAQDKGTALIEAAGARATKTKPLAWLGLENDGAAKGAALTLRLWPGDLRIHLGRACFHGRWVNWAA